MSDGQEKPVNKLLLKPNTLWKKTVKVTQSARQSGALKSIETDYHLIEQNEITFVIRSLANIERKEKARKKQQQKSQQAGKYFDPFLPYEKDLFVSDLTSTDLCLLNKVNVVDHHLLIVTRDFELQESLLNFNDFVALGACLQEIDGLAFYNGGEIAGASQKHKHLQLIPLPFFPNTKFLPITPVINQTKFSNSLSSIAHFPFKNAIARIDLTSFDNPLKAAQLMQDCYHSLFQKVGLSVDSNTTQQPQPYNLLATREWMLIVPRTQESCQGISVNSLGFAGSLFVKNQASWKLLQQISPIKLLSEVSITA